MGFSLLEVMVSLAIFSIVGIGIMKVINEKLIWSKVLENKIVSSWVADNVLAEMKLVKIKQTDNWLKGQEIMMNKVWYWQYKEIKLQNENVNKIIVEVRSQESNTTPDFMLEGYRAINE
ncbi:general secretion pathway protein I [Yersinia pekkanenii]|uniref:Type II secretion system protein I n=2 Tax=Yersinia pekkanenii TaxID=1288385 RepID=A0A0T9P9W7_9GAMM|nr:general secretion pathway protein I [Yersinia pekkanenii]CRY67830.1 general secretion pathway protein I [Yersinia pekkanenii]